MSGPDHQDLARSCAWLSVRRGHPPLQQTRADPAATRPARPATWHSRQDVPTRRRRAGSAGSRRSAVGLARRSWSERSRGTGCAASAVLPHSLSPRMSRCDCCIEIDCHRLQSALLETEQDPRRRVRHPLGGRRRRGRRAWAAAVSAVRLARRDDVEPPPSMGRATTMCSPSWERPRPGLSCGTCCARLRSISESAGSPSRNSMRVPI